MYKAIRETLNSKPVLIPVNTAYEPKNKELDYYTSLFYYNELHKTQLEQMGTLSGIKDTKTNYLFFDFDSASDLRLAQLEAVELARKLVELTSTDSVSAYFSGSKGFAVELYLNREITNKEFKAAVFALASEYKTFDKVVNDSNRIVRLVNTKHPKSGLYKIPLYLWEMDELTIAEILELAKSPRIIDVPKIRTTISESFFTIDEAPIKYMLDSPKDIDFSKKIKGWSNCKWALLQGFDVKEHDRHYKLLCVIATSKALNYTKEQAYYNAKNSSEQGYNRYGGSKAEKEAIWKLTEQVYSDTWKGGTFSCKDGKTEWLTDVCNGLGHNKCRHENEESQPITFLDLRNDFKTYVKNIDKNTIKTGIAEIDDNVFLSTGANVGIIGAAGSGKTSVGLEILNNTSKAGVRSVVASLDMARNRIFEKIMYRLSGLGRQELYQLFQNDKEEKLLEKLTQEFGNVNFFKSSSPTVQDIKEYVLKCNENGPKVKLVVIDYFERINSDFSDDTAASKKIAGELQDLVDELDVCLVTLVQPNKNAISGGPDTPIYDYTKIKGSSFVYQAFRIILSCWRPFYSPKDFKNDHYMQMAVLKNDLGELNEFALGWEGKRGLITSLEDFQKEEFAQMIRQKEERSKKSTDLF